MPGLLSKSVPCERNKQKNATAVQLHSLGASDETRTRTAISGQGILSPSCLPFHHQGFRFEGNKDTNNI